MTQSFSLALGIHLDITSDYIKQLSIGNRRYAEKLQEAVKATQIYCILLEYNESGDTFLEESDIEDIFNNIKQVFFSIKFTNYE